MRYFDEFTPNDKCSMVSGSAGKFGSLFFILLVFCLHAPSISYAFCNNINSWGNPLLYSNYWSFIGGSIGLKSVDPDEVDDPVVLNALGAKHLHVFSTDIGKGSDLVKKNELVKAVKFFKDASKMDYAPALSNLGVMYLNGWGVEESVETAKTYFTAASENGYPPALNNLGVLHIRSPKEDPLRGIRKIEAAAEKNYPPALNNLGILYLKRQKYEEAVENFERAVKFGYSPALFNLGTRYARGEGVPLNYAKATKLYEQAACRGNVHAQYSLGLMYSQGVGVKKDLSSSFIWLSLAEKSGFSAAKQVQDAVKGLLTQKQVSEATRNVKMMSPTLHTIRPPTLYDDLAMAPDLYQFDESQSEYQSWIKIYEREKRG